MIKYELWSMLVRLTHIFVCYNENFVTITIVQILWKSKNNEFSMQIVFKLSNFDLISTQKLKNIDFVLGGMEPKCPSELGVCRTLLPFINFVIRWLSNSINLRLNNALQWNYLLHLDMYSPEWWLLKYEIKLGLSWAKLSTRLASYAS